MRNLQSGNEIVNLCNDSFIFPVDASGNLTLSNYSFYCLCISSHCKILSLNFAPEFLWLSLYRQFPFRKQINIYIAWLITTQLLSRFHYKNLSIFWKPTCLLLFKNRRNSEFRSPFSINQWRHSVIGLAILGSFLIL